MGELPIPAGAVILIVAAVLLMTPGCTGSTGETVEQRHRLQISADEIVEHGGGTDLYSFVQRVRPAWLVKSGPHSGIGNDDIRVYINGMRYENPSALRFYSGSDAESLTFLEPGRATARYGVGHSHGAIVVLMRGGGYEAP
jgi:hypothetical protein